MCCSEEEAILVAQELILRSQLPIVKLQLKDPSRK